MPDPSTTRVGLYKSKSDGSELVNYTQDLGQNWDKVDAAVGFQAATSSTRPSSPYSGKPIFQTDTSYSTFFSNGTSPASASWVEIPNSSSTFGSNLKLASGSQLVIGADVNLFRNAANVLRTNDALTVDGALTASSGITITGNLTIGSATYRNGLSSGPTTVANTTTETVIATATIPAGDAVAGAIYRMTAYGVASSTGTPNFTINAKLGGVSGTTMAGIGASPTASAISGRPWHAVFYLRCVSTGVSASWSPTFVVYHNLTTGAQTGNNIQLPNSTANQTVDSTVSQAMVLTWTWGTASASNTATCTGVVFERVA